METNAKAVALCGWTPEIINLALLISDLSDFTGSKPITIDDWDGPEESQTAVSWVNSWGKEDIQLIQVEMGLCLRVNSSVFRSEKEKYALIGFASRKGMVYESYDADELC